MLDCWPQISDAVVDYYFNKKIAYHYIKRVQNPILVFITETEGWHQSVLISNDTNEDVEVSFTVIDYDKGETLLNGKRTVKAGHNIEAGKIWSTVSNQNLYIITYSVNDKEYGNHYITGLPPL